MAKYVTISRFKAYLPCLFAVILFLFLFGCGGTFRSFPGEGDVSGGWTLFLTPSNMPTLGTRLLTLDQKDNNISGTTSGATITGTVSGNNIVLTLANSDGTTTTLDGTVGADWKTMSGTYTSTGSDGAGTWSATKNGSTPTPTALSVTPTRATLSCSGRTSQTFVVTGGTPSKYSAVVSTQANFVTLSTTSLTTTGQFTVTANACISSRIPGDGLIVVIDVTDTTTRSQGYVTISNP